MSMILKNPRIKPAANGGYVLEYDRCMKSKDAYEGLSHMASETEIFGLEEGQLALDRLNEIQADATKVTSAALEAQERKESKEVESKY